MIGSNFGICRPSSTGSNNKVIQMNVGAASSERPHCQQLSDFLMQLEDYVPTIPDACINYFLHSAGFESNDPRIVRLISMATQKYISDVANNALIHCKTRTHNQQQGAAKVQKGFKDKKYTLTMDDIQPALADYGITVRKAQYYN